MNKNESRFLRSLKMLVIYFKTSDKIANTGTCSVIILDF